MKLRKALTFDDILLVPQYSDIKSIDDEIDTSVKIGQYELDIPIISAAMDTVTGGAMQRSMRFLGGLGIHHRYVADERSLLVHACDGPIAISPSMGVEFVNQLLKTSVVTKTVVIDVAHGHRKEVIDFAEYCHSLGLEVWSGNICTVDAAIEYLRKGINILKVNIGGGSVCTTRVVSGCGYPLASAIYEIKQAFPSATIICDGGVKSSGDIIKALALGADAVITGNLLAGTDETPGDIVVGPDTGGVSYKRYQGMASFESLSKNNKTVRVEGVSGLVPYKGPVKEVIDNLMSGVKLGMAYVGARSIKELQEKAEFVEITQAGQYEGMSRI